MGTRLEDYALIGDFHTTALVAKSGSMDWLCLPRFDSGACFAALLGTSEHGRWLITPELPVKEIRRRYRPDTLILETEFVTEAGTVALIDFMPIRGSSPHVIRIVEGRSGSVPMRMELVMKFDYGSVIPYVSKLEKPDRQGRPHHVLRAIAGADTLYLETEVKCDADNSQTRARFQVEPKQRVPFVLSWTSSLQTHCPDAAPEELFATTERRWKHWAERCTYEGAYREQVMRSLITLKALTYAPTGGIVAAPTTSLPEKIGGTRNWDYRYCWLRDSTFTLYALLIAGYVEEARAWREWLLRAVAGEPHQMQIMYGLAGERRLSEWEVDWLPGYEGSKPVRIGNAAFRQLQLDVFGELMDSLHFARRVGMQSNEEAWWVQKNLVEYLEGTWSKPDEGIWEVRGPKRHFTYSKVMAWVAVDRAVKAVEGYGRSGPVDRWRKLRDQIHAEVCREGFDSKRNSFVQSYGSRHLDASCLLLPLVGFLPSHDPRIRGTVLAIESGLMRDGFLQRYSSDESVDGLPQGEGAFLACTFWLVDNYVMQERYDEARALFERLLACTNDVGLLSEEFDAKEKRLVGNFPQAFSHVALVNSAFNLLEGHGPAEHRRRG